MSKYLKDREHTIQFDGDTVRARVKPLEYGDLLAVKELDSEIEIAKWAIPVLPKYITLAGLTDAEGAAITIEEVVRVAYFLPLLLELVECLIDSVKPENPPWPSAPSQ